MEALQAGDIIYDSWGYEQTNVDFYKIIEIKGRTATIQELGQDKKYTSSMSGETTPSEKTISEPIKKRICTDNSIKINESVRLSKWDGKPKFFSEYA